MFTFTTLSKIASNPLGTLEDM